MDMEISRTRAVIAMLCAALVLAGCAFGSCINQRLLQPRVIAAEAFKVDVDAENDTVLVQHPLLTIWVWSCDDRTSLIESKRGLCGTLIVPPGANLRFSSTEFRVLNTLQQQIGTNNIKPTDFSVSDVHVGTDTRPSSSWLVSRQYSLPGKRLDFSLLSASEITSQMELHLPAFTVNSVQVTFPAITISPVIGRRCYHGAW